MAAIELKATDNELMNLKKESDKSDPNLYDYVSGKVAEPYITELQRQIAELEIKRDIDLSTTTETRVKDKINADARAKIEMLRKNLDEKTEIMRVGVLSETPDENGCYRRRYSTEN